MNRLFLYVKQASQLIYELKRRMVSKDDISTFNLLKMREEMTNKF